MVDPRKLSRARLNLLLSIGAIACMAGCAGSRTARDAVRALSAAAPNASQREQVLRTVAGFKHLGFQVVAARLKLGVDTALAWRQLDTLLASPTGDIFWMYPAVGLYLNLEDRLDERWRSRFRKAWRTYTPYRGDTENHFLMYYASLLLMSQEWPGLPGSEWFNGKSSAENHRESKEYLEYWIDETVRSGSTEWDSPRYAYYYITPLILLRDFTADPALRRRCEMLLELTLADFAAEHLNGSYCGAHSRDSDGAVIDPRRAEVTSYAQLYFTDSISFVLPDLAYAAMSDWQCPSIIRAIAHDRDSSYVHTETKRSRAKMRFSAERFSTVHKYDFMTPDYCLGSIQGGVHQPIQQHTWDVTFAANGPNNTIFALHPTWSAAELGTYFPEDPDLMVDGVARAKASYTNENKWIGGSPRERVMQDGNTLVAEYEITGEDHVRHVDLFLPMSADTVIADTSGWWFVRFGDAFTAVYAKGGQDSVMIEGAWRRVRVMSSRFERSDPSAASERDSSAGLTYVTPIIVTCARASEVDFGVFIRNVLRTAPESAFIQVGGAGAQRVYRVVDGLGAQHELRHGSVDPGRKPAHGAASDAAAMFDGPHIAQAAGSAVVTLRAGGLRRVLDFEKGVIGE